MLSTPFSEINNVLHKSDMEYWWVHVTWRRTDLVSINEASCSDKILRPIVIDTCGAMRSRGD
jgi:hypothetical protein